MNNARWQTSRVANQRGAVLVLVVISLVALLGMMALAIDLGMLYAARSEAQRAAEAGAHAGAGTFLLSSGSVQAAEQQAELFAERNRVRGMDVDVRPDDDIDVDLDNQLVRVRVQHSQNRDNPVPTIFARALGIRTVDIGAVAAAQVWTAAQAQCLLPFALPDRWCESGDGVNCNQLATATDDWDPVDDGDYYVPWVQNPTADPSEWTYNNNHTGYSRDDRGAVIQLRPAPTGGGGGQGQGQGGGGDDGVSNQVRWNPSWWNTFRPPGASGVPDIQARIRGCVDGDVPLGVGSEVQVEPGNFSNPILSAFNELIAKDPTAEWNAGAMNGQGCVTTRGSSECRSSDRIRPMVLFDPRNGPDNGAQYFPLSNVVAVFIESATGGGSNITVTARFVEYTGANSAAGGAGSNSLVQVLRIVE